MWKNIQCVKIHTSGKNFHIYMYITAGWSQLQVSLIDYGARQYPNLLNTEMFLKLLMHGQINSRGKLTQQIERWWKKNRWPSNIVNPWWACTERVITVVTLCVCVCVCVPALLVDNRGNNALSLLTLETNRLPQGTININTIPPQIRNTHI